jgi:hypothetical protein
MRISLWMIFGLAAIGKVGAFPGFTLEMTLGGGLGATPHQFHGDFGGGSGYEVLEAAYAGEVQVRGPWSAGLRASAGVDGIGMGRGAYRGQLALTPFVSRRMLKVGRFESDLHGGLGWQWYQLEYDDGGVDQEHRDADLPPDEDYQSPQVEIGATQRLFFKVIGLSVQESFQISLHSLTIGVRFAVPVGWRPRPAGSRKAPISDF